MAPFMTQLKTEERTAQRRVPQRSLFPATEVRKEYRCIPGCDASHQVPQSSWRTRLEQAPLPATT
jgi:hypothetical protein